MIRGLPVLLVVSCLGAQQFARVGREAVPRDTSYGWTLLVDLDADGALDMFTGTGSWYHNDGRGHFTARPLAVVLGVKYVVGDFDGDGDQDIFASGFVLENRGPLGPVWRTSNVNDAPLATGDFNGDQKTDVVTQQGVAMATSLTTFQMIPMSAGYQPLAVVADIDGDGDLDIVRTTNPYILQSPWGSIPIPGSWSVSRNDGGGVWTTISPFGAAWTNAVTTKVVAFDADGDGNVDCGFLQPSGWQFFRNVGGGVFTPWVGLSLPLMALDVCDLDQDGDLDLVAAGWWCENDGSGVFTLHELPSVDLPLHAVGDVDGDGDLDLVFGDSGSERRLLLNQGAQDFVDASAWAWCGYTTPSLAIGDVNQDGFPDLLSEDNVLGNPPSPATLWRNLADGWFERTPGVDCTFLVDIDGDGDLDAVSFSGAHIALNNGAGVFTPASMTVVPVHAITPRLAFDANGDGHMDLLASDFSYFSSTFEVLLNSGQVPLVFNSQGFVTLPGGFATAAAGDFDNDGDVDLLFGVNLPGWSGAVCMFRNDGTGGFVLDPAGVVGSSGSPVISLAVADLDGDGDLDVLVGRRDGANPQHLVLRNAGGVLTGDPAAVPVHTAAGHAVLGDVDGDGDLDAVVLVGAGTPTNPLGLHLWTNDGTGHFAFAENLQLVDDPVALVDVDRDGDADLFAGRRLYLNRQWHFEAPFLAQTGTTYEFRFGGRAMPNALALPWFGVRSFLQLPGLGSLGLDPLTAIPLTPTFLNGEMAQQSFAIPANPALVGMGFSVQALLLANGVLHLTPAKHEIVWA